MPEELPTPKKSLKQLEKENKRNLKNTEMKNINGGNNNMELWEVLDDNGNPTGEIMKKYNQKVFDRGFYHLGADVWIINSDNKITNRRNEIIGVRYGIKGKVTIIK